MMRKRWEVFIDHGAIRELAVARFWTRRGAERCVRYFEFYVLPAGALGLYKVRDRDKADTTPQEADNG